MLNIAGPEYDFGSVVFVVLEECEHRRRGFEADELEYQLKTLVKAKLKKIKKAYDEFGGSAQYWSALETEVMETVLPQYIDAAEEMNRLERTGFDVWRRGDLPARGLFGLGGLLLGGFLLALPFVPKLYEAMFALVSGAAGITYPDLKRFLYERRHVRLLNRLVTDAARYQQNSRLHYMTTNDIRESFTVSAPSIGETTTTPEREAE